jgi:hypothetical protein
MEPARYPDTYCEKLLDVIKRKAEGEEKASIVAGKSA